MRIVVFTCDAYLWLVPTFLHFYEKMWPDNPYQTDFVTETKEIARQTSFFAGKIQWADRAIKYFESCEEQVFLLLHEDYIFTKLINTTMIKKAEKLCVDNIGCVRLNAHDSWSQFLFDTKIEGFKEYPLDRSYSISLQAAIWQKEFLLEFLQKGESVWQVEIEGSRRVHVSKKRVIWSDIPIINYQAGGYMRKGRIVKLVKQWAEENW